MEINEIILTFMGLSVAVNIDFLDISKFRALDLSELYRYITPLTIFLVNKPCSLQRLVLIFQPTVNSSGSDK